MTAIDPFGPIRRSPWRTSVLELHRPYNSRPFIPRVQSWANCPHACATSKLKILRFMRLGFLVCLLHCLFHLIASPHEDRSLSALDCLLLEKHSRLVYRPPCVSIDLVLAKIQRWDRGYSA